jgi:hypothetical protein
VSTEAYVYSKRGLLIQQKSLRIQQKRPTHTTKEAYVYSKRGLRIQQKRPSTTKEAYSYGKRDLVRQKRPTYTAKEAYAYGKRGLYLSPSSRALLGRNAFWVVTKAS